MIRRSAALLALSLLIALPAVAQRQDSTAKGEVSDADGNPLKGVVVKFWPETDEARIYTGKTNKKGRYFITGLYSARQGEGWHVAVEYEDWVPVEMTLENRNGQKVLLGDIKTKKLPVGAKIPSIPIRPLGTATVDFKLADAATAAELSTVPGGTAADPTAVVSGGSGRKGDVWGEALDMAAQQRWAEAVPLLAKAVEEEPEDPERLSTQAKVLYRIARFDQAKLAAEKAIEFEPGRADHYTLLYTIEVSREDLAAAAAALERARAINPNSKDVWKQTAFLASRSEDVDAEIAAYEKVVEIDAADAEAWTSLGDLYTRKGDTAKSEAAYQRVVEIAPDNAHQVFFNLGALVMNGDDLSDAQVDKAISAFRKALEIKPDYAAAYKQLGFALLNKGDRAGAKSSLEKYVELAGDAPDAASMKGIISTLQ